MGALKKLIDEMQTRKDVVPQGYPSPQAEVNTARDIGPHVPRQQGSNAKGDNVIDAEFKEVKKEEKKPSRGISGEFAAIGREAVKDIRGTMMQVFFGQPEHPGEPGTPYNPTQQMVTQELKGGERDFER